MASNIVRSFLDRLSPVTRANLLVRAFGLSKVPLIFHTGLRVVAIDAEHCVVRMPYRRRNRNHLRSLYIGVMMVGADVAGGLLAFQRVHESGRRVSFAFKDVQARFLKRAEGDTFFECSDGVAITRAVDETFRTGERVNQAVRVVATTPTRLGDEPVAEFDLTLSVKALG